MHCMCHEAERMENMRISRMLLGIGGAAAVSTLLAAQGTAPSRGEPQGADDQGTSDK